MDLYDRYLGAILGCAIGDALGAAVEFRPRGSFRLVKSMRGGGPHNLRPGEWTDDTSLMLCLAASLLHCGESDLIDQLKRYNKWRISGYMAVNERGCFDIGNATKKSLSLYSRTKQKYCGAADAAGNGSLMRLAPIPLFFFLDDPAVAIEEAGEQSRSTHGHVEAIDACRYMCSIMLGALAGWPKEKILSKYFSPMGRKYFQEDCRLRAGVRRIASGSFRQKSVDEVRGRGYVVDTLEAVLWSAFNFDTFEDCVLNVINLGDDSDTTGAICGFLCGAIHGASSIPSEWKETVAKANLLTSIAGDLLRSSLMRHIPSVWTDQILSIDPLEPVSSSSSSAEGSSEETSRLDSEKMTPSLSSVLDLADQLARDGESCSWWWLRSKNSAVRFVEDVYPSIDQQLDSIVLSSEVVVEEEEEEDASTSMPSSISTQVNE